MSDPQLALGALVRRALADAFGPAHAGRDVMVRRSQHADLQVDVALPLARELGRPPREVAQALAAALPASDLIERVTVAGPGFLNVDLRTAWLEAAAERAVADERLCVPRADTPDRVVIDYSAPNVAKEMHVGHLRTTIIGDALARVLALRGHTVIRQNHLGDWGTPVGMVIELLVERRCDDADIGQLQELYVTANDRFDRDPEFAERARARVVALQSGDAHTVALWQRLVAVSRAYIEQVYSALGVLLVRSDERPESAYHDQLAPLADELAASGHAQQSEGALCVFLDGESAPLIVRKQDGGFGYAATDLAAIRYRIRELRATRLLYVVGAPQARHLAMVFEAARAFGWLAPPVRAHHVAFGSVLGEDGRKLSSREGRAVRLIDLIDAAVARADGELAPDTPERPAIASRDSLPASSAAEGRRGSIASRDSLPASSAAEGRRGSIARAVGVGAIKYADLSCERHHDYVFDLARMVAFRGDAAGYLQYAHARCCSILERAGAWSPGAIRCGTAVERALAFTLLRFGGAVALVDDRLEPHHLAAHLHDTAMCFSAFYENPACDVLVADRATRVSRLTLTRLTARTLACGLDLLGIAAPERM